MSERARAEGTLRENEALYRSLFEHMLNGIAYCQMLFEGDQPRDFIYLAVNAAFEKQTGLKDVVGKRASMAIPGIRESDPELLAIYGRVARTGQHEHFEMFVTTLQMWFSVSVYCPKRGYFVAVFDVITERKQTENALRESEKRHRHLFETMTQGVTYQKADGAIISANPAAERILGLSLAQMLGKTSMDSGWKAVREDDSELPGQDHPAMVALRTGKPVEHFVMGVFNPRTGSHSWISVNAIPLFKPGETTPFQVFTTFDDISAQRLIEDQLHQAQKMETVGRLAGGVAHEFNNMLQVITSYAELCLEKIDTGHPVHKYMLEISRAAWRSAEITGQLLAFARKQTVRPKLIDLNAAIARAQKMILGLIGEDVELAWAPGHDLWKVKIDPVQLDQVFANLVVNARDAIEGTGTLTIELENTAFDEASSAAHAGSAPGEYLLLSVRDNGRGMDKETLSHLFEPFFTTKGLGEGTGLGLATVYGIVQQNGGFIDVESEPGHGSIFKVYLPRARESGTEDWREVEAVVPIGGSETVLVVEDEAPILELARRSLQQIGYRVLAAGSTEEALRMSKDHPGPIDLLLTDVVMPRMNGRQLAELLEAERPGLKCLYMSGHTAEVIAGRGILESGVSFIAKPFSLAALAEKVREVLDALP
jgi:two-component system cell cycle sensor histidine kinase/response regulator CckA